MPMVGAGSMMLSSFDFDALMCGVGCVCAAMVDRCSWFGAGGVGGDIRRPLHTFAGCPSGLQLWQVMLYAGLWFLPPWWNLPPQPGHVCVV